MNIKKEYIIAGVGALALFAFLYYKNRTPQRRPRSAGNTGGNTNNTNNTGAGTGGTGAGNENTGNVSGEDDVFAVVTTGGNNTYVPPTSSNFNVNLARKQCSLKGGTWMPNSSGGGKCIKIPPPTTATIPTGSVLNPRNQTNIGSSGGNSGGTTSGGSMALTEYQSGGGVAYNRSNTLGSGGEYGINVIDLNQYK